MIRPKVHKWLSRAEERDGREIVMLRDAGVCVRCRRVDPLFGVNHDHRLNRSQGGDWSPSNGQLMCGSGTTGCHGTVTGNPTDAVRDGWAVPGYGNAIEWPARRWVSHPLGYLELVWVLYDDVGGWSVIGEKEARERMTSMGWAA